MYAKLVHIITNEPIFVYDKLVIIIVVDVLYTFT